MILEKTITLTPEGIFNCEAVKSLMSEITLSRMPYAVIDCSEITILLAEAVSCFRDELDHFQGGSVHIQIINLKSAMVLQFQLYDFIVESGKILVDSDAVEKGVPRKDFMRDHEISIICRKCRQNLRVHSKGLHVCPNCGSKLHVDSYGRTKYYEPLRLFTR